MKEIEQLLNKLPLAQLQSNICLDCDGAQLYVDGTNGSLSTVEVRDVDAVIHVSQEHLLAILHGDESAVGLFTSGQITIDGDVSIAFRLKDILG
ncbi:SCP2 sterol-binding domain-containing protein [Candidatus Synchoanobacter obligatus]|uniref:SCP2 sterol-binding domain-containing protein n=1 Tax=Candidatus Synchoanobacter obligatus TaxID=2919597 RepID=A0ABT1L529_9GAMM|nr:SCP2 sterol-binding domain-containing protein [Candidatus Synchoanobacter obligatus]MCP8352284.1 SCP2 sterol-binding domain-containing protein [Candidatus Synchoanobacter obligatus]